MTLTYGSWSKGHHDLYFTVQWFCLISWRLFDIWTPYFRIMSKYDTTLTQLWPIFHGPVILPYILKTVWCMNIILQDYESVWPDIWPQNKCRSLWPIYHGPVILPYILKTIWYMNTIPRDYESVWPDIWPQNKCRSLWPLFHGPVILPYILKTVWCMNFILLSQGRFDQCVWQLMAFIALRWKQNDYNTICFI